MIRVLWAVASSKRVFIGAAAVDDRDRDFKQPEVNRQLTAMVDSSRVFDPLKIARFFLSGLRIGSERTGVVMRTPPLASKLMLGPSACAPLPSSSTVLGFASVERSSACAPGEIWTYHH
jgi:hypothetical protein